MVFKNYDPNKDDNTPIPKEIYQHYIKHGYEKMGIPLNADTCNKIYDICEDVEKWKNQKKNLVTQEKSI